MLDKNRILDMIQDKEVQKIQGSNFLLGLLKELEKESNKSEQVAYVEKLEEAGRIMLAKDRQELLQMFEEGEQKIEDRLSAEELSKRMDWVDFQEALMDFIVKNKLIDVTSPKGRTPIHFIGAFDAATLVEPLPVKKIFELYEMKDNKGQDVFAGRDGLECQAMLEILKPQDRVDFLLRNKHVLAPLYGDDILNIVTDLNKEQQVALFFSKTQEQPSIWEQLRPEAREVLLKEVPPQMHAKWRSGFKGPNELDQGRSSRS